MQKLIESVGSLSARERKALAVLLKQKGINLFGVAPIFRRDASEPLLPSYAQQRQWFLWQLEPGSAAYNLPKALRLRGRLDLAALQRSFAALIARHESLRTRFVEEEGRVLQCITPPWCPDLEPVALAVPTEDAIHEHVAREVARPFDLTCGPLLRTSLLRLAEDDHVLLLTLHHSVGDGWSMQLLVDELVQLYAAHAEGRQPGLAELPIQYADYALWQRQWMEAGERERQLAYWTARLAGEQSVLGLPLDRPRPAQQSFAGASWPIELDESTLRELKELAQRENVTLFMLLLASFQVLLHRSSGQRDIRVGVPIANRGRAETERLIGFFVNTQVLRAEVDGQASGRELLRQVRQAALEAQEFQDLPFEQLVEALQPERSLGHNPLFQVMFNHQAEARQESRVQLPGLSVEGLEWENRSAQFDLSLNTVEHAQGLSAALTYATDLFEPATIERMARHWQNLLRGMVEDPQRAVGELPMLDVGERELIVQRWNATGTDYPLQRGVHQLFEEQAERHPDAPALAFGEQRLSYAELNARANRLAHALIERGVGPDSLVGIAVERSVEMVVGLMAILKAGGAYVPLDPEYPAERLAYMLEDSGVKLLLSQSHLNLPGVQRINLDQASDWLEGYSEANPAVTLDGESLAYVIYTSGSTGKPKGAGNRHRALTNRLCWMQEAYGLDASDTVLQKTPFSFDVSVWEFFWPLMTGARLVVAAPGDHRDPAKLVELIDREGVTTLHFVPSMLQAFLQDESVSSCSSLKRIVCSGEALPVDAQQQVFAKLPSTGLYNLYGPTEAAIDVTHWTCVDEGKDAVPIGKPIANLGCYILDDSLEPVPVGVLGELYLAGEGLARGYHQRPSLTAERFVASPFVAGARMYRTGDLARYRADGVIEYAGRIDHQVKLRGLRIELGEIEARLLEHELVREAAVLAVDGKQLVGYVVLNTEQDNWRETLAAHLAASLPEYMVPTQWLALENMPLSPNGKLDRKALPKPQQDPQQERVAPQNEMERRIAAIWAELLKLDEVGATDNFFALGGDSIVSIQVVSRARAAGIHFTPKELFQHQTVQALARVARSGATAQADQGPVVGETPLLPFQRLFFEQAIPNRQHWNQSLLLQPRQPLDAEALEGALQALVAHHDALRLRFTEVDGQWRAEHAGITGETLLWQADAADSHAVEALCEEAQRSLDLARGPLLRALLVTVADGSQRLLLAIHHLVVDGVSWRILLEDLQRAYEQRRAGQSPQLPPKTSAFKTWAEHLSEYAQGPQMQGELDYWQQQLSDAPDSLPCRDPQGALEVRHARSVRTRLDSELTRRLLQEAPAAYRTQVNDLLLTALARVICRWSGDASVLVQLEGHGREDLFDDLDLSRSVGWFTSLFPVRLAPAENLGESLKAVKEQLRGIPNKGLGYGLLRYLAGKETAQALASLPQARITFNYLGRFDGQFDEAALLEPARESAGMEMDASAPLGNWLSINGQVYDGELSLDWTFSERMFDLEPLQQLADAYAAELAELVSYCADPAHRGVTPSDFPLAGLTQAQLDALPLAVEAIEDIYPLSPMQQGMLFHSLYEQGSGDYINQMQVPVEGLDVERFRAAWQASLAGHPILRSAFFWGEAFETPVQVVLRDLRIEVAEMDLPASGTSLEQLAERERSRGFDPSRPPLLRLLLVRTGARSHHLVYTGHHILLDGWSTARLLGEVLQRYAGEAPVLPAGSYRDYIAWLQRQDRGASERYWKQQLARLEESTRLARTLPAGAAEDAAHAEFACLLDGPATQRLQAFARQRQVTLNTLVQAAWLLLLQRYTGQSTVAFGATVAGRPTDLPGVEEQVGLFINTLPVIAEPRAEQTLGDWLADLQAQNLELREHEHTPLYDIQRWAGLGGEALFDSILVFENYPVAEALNQAPAGLRFGEVHSHEQTNYPLTLGVNLGEQLSLHFGYVPASFSAEHVRRLAAQLLSLLQRFEAAVGRPLGTLPILAEDELAALLASNAPCPYPVEPYVHQRIARLARADGSRTALIFDGRRHARGEIEARANRLAHALIAEGVGPEVRVAVGLPRGDTLLVALLAVLKAGGVYVPLDIGYPRERLAFLLEDSGSALLLSLSGTAEALPAPLGGRMLLLDGLDLDAWPADEPQVRLHPENLAYVIYTSGSTGRPKGVAVAHGPLAMHCQAIGERYEMSEADCELHFMSFAFDGAHERWLTALTHGSSLLLRDDELWTAERTYREMQRHGVTVAAFPPAYLQQLAEHAEHEGNPPAVRIYCFGGDAVPRASYERARAALSPDYIINGYGPTETVVTPLIWKAGRGEECDAPYAPIGSRIGDRSAYVLDAELNPLPQGVTGELYLGGHGLARGYLDRPGMSAERFVADPFTRGGRLYRTGDLVRQRPDGTFEYQGRVDNQVKIRGFRIELGEIEACLLACEPVREAVVVARQGASGRQLAAYVTLDGPPAAGLRERLLEQLGQRLPGYMVPASLTLLEQLPLTPNGKIDRKALPEPLPSQRGEHYLAPRNPLERRLLDIWQAALRLDRIGIGDNFFELGGDSIVSIQVVSRARAAGIHFTPKELFQHQTVQALARVARSGATTQADQRPVVGETPLLPFQRLFFEQAIPNRQHWNQSLLLQPRQALDAEALEGALQALVEHHDALRLRFTKVDGQWRAEHAGITGETLLWQAEATDSHAVEALCEEAQRSLDLARGPLLRALLVTVADGSQRLLLAIHHLVVDGVSWRILLEDLQRAYEQRRAGQSPQLPPKTSAFKTWAEHLSEYAQGPQMQGELDYWQQQLSDAPDSLPCRDPQGALEVRHARSVRTRLDSELTRRLLQEAPAAYRTQVNDLLLTALARVICRWSGDASVLVQLEGHGREDLFDDLDLSRSVGWFTSLFPVRLEPTEDLGESLKSVKEQLRGIPNKGLGYGLLRYLASAETAQALASLPQARITFNYLGRFDGQFDEAALLEPARESAGMEMDDGAPLGNWLSINGQVYDGELSLDWTFSERMFDLEPLQQLADAYAAELAELVGYCADPAHRGVTPSDFPLAGLTQAQLDALPLAVEAIEDIYPLSPMQQGMLFHSLSDEGDGLYLNQVCMPVEGLDVERFRAAWQDALDRHDILRTSFHWQGLGDPLQIVQRRARMDIRCVDLRAGEAPEQFLAAIAREELERGFDLACLPLQRLVLVRTAENSHQLVWTSHHILMDGWSSSRLFGEVMQHYAEGRVEGAQARYRDFVAWLQRQDRNALEGFWRERLASLDEPCSLSQASYPRPEPGLQGHEALYTHWDGERTARLLQHCRQQGITPNTLVQAAWLLLLQRYTGQRSVTFGATVAGRPESLPGADDMLGLFINTLPVIQELDPQLRLDQWLARLQAYNLDLRENAHAPLADVQRWSGQGGQMLFDSIIVFENYPIDARLQAEQGDEGPRFGASSNRDVTNFPMDLAVHLGEELSIEYLFLRNRFSREAVERIRRTLEATLEAMLRTPQECLGNLQRLAEPDREALLAWAREPAPGHRRLTVSALIAERAAQQPEATALVCGSAQLSYAELERRAGRLAQRLVARGIGPETKVGVALERSLSMPVALLAVLKAGGAYVPLDLDYPAERLAFMVEDSGMRLLIGRAGVRERLALPAGLALLDPELEEDSPAPLAVGPEPVEDNLAYLIYTSGSTGTPKGVAVTQGPLAMHCQAIIELYGMGPGTRELHFMSFAFDGAHERWLSLLVSGGTLVLRDDELWTPERTFQVLGEQRVDIACFPPAYLKQLAEYAEGSQLPPPPVRIYCFGGDAVAEKALEQVAAALRPQHFVNGYGPTETVVTPMLWKVPSGVSCGAPYAPIGRAVGQRSLWVMDDDMNPLPMCLAGELYIGGYGLARGYNARPALTAERFVPDPNGAPGARLYRTGDLVRVRDDGVMDYLGRVDHQVKVRGFRIELGEIEACLRRQAGVGEALVIARESPSGKQLVGYVACSEPGAGERLRAALRESLPEYMVPAQVVCLERLPLTPNGKLDRKALPEPELRTGDYVAPRTEEEALLAEVWAQVLQVEQVGIHDNFFELGGDSILSLQVVSRLRNHPRLQLEVKLRDLMRYQTIAGLCERNAVGRAAAPQAGERTVREGAFPLLPIQEWFFAEAMPEPGHFNQALLLRSRQALDVVALELALRDMLRQHDSLRLRFVRDGSAWQQSYGPMPPEDQALLWLGQAADEAELEELANRAQRSLDLERGPLLRGLYVTMAGGDVRLLLAVHHLAIDAVSWRVLLADLQSAYEARCAGREVQLPARSSSYREWAEGLAAKAGELREQELAYWLEALDGAETEFPCDNPRGRNQVRHQAFVAMKLSPEHTALLLKQAPRAYQAQINDLLLTALARVLCRWSGNASARVQLEGHGREDLCESLDLSRTLGWFTSVFPVHLAPGLEADLAAAVTAVRRQLEQVPNKGVGYGVLRYMAGEATASLLGGLPQARVTFNYLGQFDQTFDEQALLVPATESSGEAYSLDAPLGNWLEVVGQVFDSRLSFRCLYSTRRYRPATVERFMAAFQAELEQLVEQLPG